MLDFVNHDGTETMPMPMAMVFGRDPFADVGKLIQN